MPDSIDELVALLQVDPIEADVYRGGGIGREGDRIFGGQILGQALMAAARSMAGDDREVHSMHGYFLRTGNPALPIDYRVDRTRDGRSFSARRVVAEQEGRALFEMLLSFQVSEPGFAHQRDESVEAPEPESLPTYEECLAEVERENPHLIQDWMRRQGGIEQRPVDGFFARHEKRDAFQRVWLRSARRLPDSPRIHQAVLAYACDMALIDTAAFPHGLGDGAGAQVFSLDHAMWFHRPFRMDDWLLYALDSPTAGGARGFVRGRVFTRDGELVVTVVQEGLLRPSRSLGSTSPRPRAGVSG